MSRNDLAQAVISNGRSKPEDFTAISRANIELVRELTDIAKELDKSGNHKDAKKVITVIKKLLSNNQRLLEVVGEALADITG